MHRIRLQPLLQAEGRFACLVYARIWWRLHDLEVSYVHYSAPLSICGFTLSLAWYVKNWKLGTNGISKRDRRASFLTVRFEVGQAGYGRICFINTPQHLAWTYHCHPKFRYISVARRSNCANSLLRLIFASPRNFRTCLRIHLRSLPSRRSSSPTGLLQRSSCRISITPPPPRINILARSKCSKAA